MKTLPEIAEIVKTLELDPRVDLVFSPNGGSIFVQCRIKKGVGAKLALSLVKTAKADLAALLLSVDAGRKMHHETHRGYKFWRMYSGEYSKIHDGWRAGVKIETTREERMPVLIGGGSVQKIWGSV